MRKVISILLIIVLFINLSGYYLFYQVRLWEVKTAMKESLRNNSNNDHVLNFSFDVQQAKSIEWEDEHEFRLNGEMYDVIAKHTEGNRLMIKCISDKDEDLLLQQFRTKNNEEKKNSKSAIALLKAASNFFEPVLPITIEALPVNKLEHFIKHGSTLFFTDQQILTPPPQIG